jgi:hypothetical protein
VHEAHLSLLRRQASSKPSDAAGLQLKVRAIDRLIRAFSVEDSPQLLETLRVELLDSMERADALGVARAQAAASMAAKCLSRLDDRVRKVQESTKPPETMWNDPALSREDAMTWLELDVFDELRRCMGWYPVDDDQHAFLSRECEAILASDSPLDSANAWLKAHWREDAVPAPVPADYGPEYDDAEPDELD